MDVKRRGFLKWFSAVIGGLVAGQAVASEGPASASALAHAGPVETQDRPLRFAVLDFNSRENYEFNCPVMLKRIRWHGENQLEVVYAPHEEMKAVVKAPSELYLRDFK